MLQIVRLALALCNKANWWRITRRSLCPLSVTATRWKKSSWPLSLRLLNFGTMLLGTKLKVSRIIGISHLPISTAVRCFVGDFVSRNAVLNSSAFLAKTMHHLMLSLACLMWSNWTTQIHCWGGVLKLSLSPFTFILVQMTRMCWNV